MSFFRSSLSWVGLGAGPTAWACSFQANYALASWQCRSGHIIAPWISLAGILVAVIGGLSSYFVWRQSDVPTRSPLELQTERFLGSIGMALSTLFIAVMLMQVVAALSFGGCEL
jgi:hypothetical protein